ncbi:MAG: sterol desaturase family protein [Sphingobacteriales bacterium]|nr:MAG: sterol desaturase family protein [Sphingobacteriales bacterium]
MLDSDLSQPIHFSITTLVFFVVITGRYFLIAGLFQLFFYGIGRDKWTTRKLNNVPYRKTQLRREIMWSMVSGLIFAITGSIMALCWQRGLTRIYLDHETYPWIWMPASLILYMLLHETYYYWLHRWMHHPRIFKIVHKVHHESKITSPWTAFSFHPVEGFLQAIFLPALLFFIPIHISVLLLQLTIMTISSVVNHLDIEIYPKGFDRHRVGKWLIGASHHSLHHSQFKYNFGLYFTFWDKWKNTESPRYPQLFESKTAGETARNADSLTQSEPVKSA